jgi:hypothetical protein
MRQLLKITASVLLITTASISPSLAGETGEPVGGFAIVHPETGVVHGVIVGSIEYFGSNDRTMSHEYMGCPAGCLIIQQSTSDQNGNVAGIHGPGVTYNQERNVFQSVQSDTTQAQSVTESASNSYAIETEISVSRSAQVYEFGVQNFTNTNGQFQLTEVAPPSNTRAEVFATTKEFECEESVLLCSSRVSNSSTTLSEEVTTFSERKSSEQVLAQIVTEAKTKLREQIRLILSMLKRWIIE